jgi:hypothetical protein
MWSSCTTRGISSSRLHRPNPALTGESNNDGNGQPLGEGSEPHVMFINRYFYREHSATSLFLSDLFDVSAQGRRVSYQPARTR